MIDFISIRLYHIFLAYYIRTSISKRRTYRIYSIQIRRHHIFQRQNKSTSVLKRRRYMIYSI